MSMQSMVQYHRVIAVAPSHVTMGSDVQCALGQIRSVSAILVLAVVQGMAFWWKTAVQTTLEDPDGLFHVTADQDAWILSLFDLGVLFGVLLGTGVLAYTGTGRHSLLLAPVFYITWIVATYEAEGPGLLMLARTLAGVAQGVMLMYAPIYIGEVATRRLRGVLILTAALLCVLGGLFSYGVAPHVSFRVLVLLPLPLLAVAVLLMATWMEESPYGLLASHPVCRDATLRATVRRLRPGWSEDAVNREADSIRSDIERQRREAPTWWRTFSPPGTKLAAFVVVVLSGTTELIGVYTLIGAKDYFFKESTRPLGYFTFNLVFISAIAGGALLAVAMIETVGRRFQYGIATLANFVAFAGLAGYYLVKEHFPDVHYEDLRWIPFVSLLVFSAGTGVGVLNVPKVMMGELLNERAKVVVVLAAGLVVSISSFLINRLFLLVCGNSGFAVAFILYAIANLLNVAFAFDPMPETKGLTLVEIQSMLAEKEKSFGLLRLFRWVFNRQK